jgi:hypothetical protein
VALQVTGSGGVPASGVSVVVLNVTVTAPAKAGYVSAYADGAYPPATSNLNFVACEKRTKAAAPTHTAIV